jgi:hypothetical protein
MKKVFVVLLIAILGVVIWFAFALWVGIYSVYSFPPSKEHPDGATFIVDRDQGEPSFNSPDYVPPKREKSSGGIVSFDRFNSRVRPVSDRTIVKLPYIEWAYEKSLKTEPK